MEWILWRDKDARMASRYVERDNDVWIQNTFLNWNNTLTFNFQNTFNFRLSKPFIKLFEIQWTLKIIIKSMFGIWNKRILNQKHFTCEIILDDVIFDAFIDPKTCVHRMKTLNLVLEINTKFRCKREHNRSVTMF